MSDNVCMTDSEIETGNLVLKYVESYRLEDLEKAKKDYDDINKDINDSFAIHEVHDRTYMLYETWLHYIQNNAVVLSRPEVYRCAVLVSGFMMHLYGELLRSQDKGEIKV